MTYVGQITCWRISEGYLNNIASNVNFILKKRVKYVRRRIKSGQKKLGSENQASYVLSLKWDHIQDTVVVSRGVNRQLKNNVTQCKVLSFVCSVFDPIGLVTPNTVRARLLLKEIWRISGQQGRAL